MTVKKDLGFCVKALRDMNEIVVQQIRRSATCAAVEIKSNFKQVVLRINPQSTNKIGWGLKEFLLFVTGCWKKNWKKGEAEQMEPTTKLLTI